MATMTLSRQEKAENYPVKAEVMFNEVMSQIGTTELIQTQTAVLLAQTAAQISISYALSEIMKELNYINNTLVRMEGVMKTQR
jgi:hypothetical protein